MTRYPKGIIKYFKVETLYTCFLLFLISSLPANAQIIKINRINCNLSSEEEAYFTKIATFEAKFYNTVFETQRNDSCKVNIDLFGKLKEYNAVQKQDMNTTFIDGFYMPWTNRIFMYKSDQYMNTLIHETSHCILENNFKHSPQWLNEGVATLFGSLVIQNGEVYYTKDTPRICFVKDMIYDGKFNLKDFFNYKPGDFSDHDKRPYVYSVSYAIIYFLVNFDIDYLQRTLVLMQQGYNTMAAFDKVFGGFDKFAKRFNDFYKPEQGYRAHRFTYN